MAVSYPRAVRLSDLTPRGDSDRIRPNDGYVFYTKYEGGDWWVQKLGAPMRGCGRDGPAAVKFSNGRIYDSVLARRGYSPWR